MYRRGVGVAHVASDDAPGELSRLKMARGPDRAVEVMRRESRCIPRSGRVERIVGRQRCTSRMIEVRTGEIVGGTRQRSESKAISRLEGQGRALVFAKGGDRRCARLGGVGRY